MEISYRIRFGVLFLIVVVLTVASFSIFTPGWCRLVIKHETREGKLFVPLLSFLCKQPSESGFLDKNEEQRFCAAYYKLHTKPQRIGILLIVVGFVANIFSLFLGIVFLFPVCVDCAIPFWAVWNIICGASYSSGGFLFLFAYSGTLAKYNEKKLNMDVDIARSHVGYSVILVIINGVLEIAGGAILMYLNGRLSNASTELLTTTTEENTSQKTTTNKTLPS